MKVMIVTPYFAPKIGGLETYALNVAKGLKKAGNDVFVVTTNHESKLQVEEHIEGLRVIRLPILFKLSNTPINPMWYRSMRRIIAAEKPDIIDAHSPVPFIADMAYLARGNAKFVITYHAGSMKKGSGMLDTVLGLYEKTALKNMFLNSDAVISVYPAFVEKLTANSIPVNFIPPGADTSVFKPGIRKSTDTKVILYVGRIERSSAWKGIATLLTALSEVRKTNPNAVLKLVGEGDAIEDYRHMADELGLDGSVLFSGALRGKALVDVFHTADMLVLPSETDAEAFGTVLVEAMACGLPVIGSKIGGIPNVIRHNKTGLLVSPGNYRELAKAINSLLDDKTLSKRLAAQGFDAAQNHFSVDQLVTRTQQLLERL